MNAKRTSLFGIIAGICLFASMAMADTRGSARASSAPHMSAGATSGQGISGASATMPRPFSRSTFSPRFGTRGSGIGASTSYHHHHHNRVVFVGDFGYPFGYPYWYDYYPYSYYDYGQPMVYDDGSGYDGSLVADVQQRLARAGYYHGAIDGVRGPETRRAIRSYERAHGLRADGMISDALIARMGLR